MSIAINTHRGRTAERAREAAKVTVVETSPEAQLRENRALMRHFVLAFTGAATALYAVVASGLTG